jgi:hypothetical protein
MLKITVIILFAVIGLFIYVKYLEARSLFYPSKKIEYTPREIGLGFTDTYFKTEDGKTINAWFIPAKEAKYTILFFHGNGGNISHRLDKIKILNNLGLNIFIIDYRGYGKSEGKPSEKGVYLDAGAAYDYLVKIKGINPDSIIIYGESLGGAVAIELCTKVRAKALITEEAFSNISDMGKIMYPYIPSFFVSDKFNSLARIEKINLPKLFIHSRNDNLVPFELGEKLYKKAKEPKQLAAITGDHNHAFLESEKDYTGYIREFVKGLK